MIPHLSSNFCVFTKGNFRNQDLTLQTEICVNPFSAGILKNQFLRGGGGSY